MMPMDARFSRSIQEPPPQVSPLQGLSDTPQAETADTAAPVLATTMAITIIAVRTVVITAAISIKLG